MKAITPVLAILLVVTTISNSSGATQKLQSQSLASNQPKEPNQKIATHAEENYFKTWVEFRDKRRFDKIQDLLKKMTEEELVLAVKQTYDWFAEQRRYPTDENYENTTWQAVGDFAGKYLSSPLDPSPEPFLEILGSTSDDLFRRMLIKCFSRSYDNKECAYFQNAFDNLIKILSDANEPPKLRQTAESTISRMLGRRYRRIQMSQNELNKLSVKELLSFPKGELSPETQERIKVLADNYNRYIWAGLSLTQRDLTLYEKLLYGAELSEQKKHGFITDPALIDALDNTVNKLELNKDELIEGVKQVNENITERKNKNERPSMDVGWEGEAVFTAGGFIESYFRRFPDESPKPFLEMAADKSNDGDFRKAMLGMLGDDDFYNLQKKDFEMFCNIFLEIAADDKNPDSIKKESVKSLLRQLGRLETANKNDMLLLQKISIIRKKATQKSL